jgi:hypothetical protein
MPVKYSDRLNISVEGINKIKFHTNNGLFIAEGYLKVVFPQKGPLIEFSEKQINQENIHIPQQQIWRIKNPSSFYIEYRSKDYCNVKIMQIKKDRFEMKSSFFYISPFDLKSDVADVLIQPLFRKQTLSALS